MTTAIMVFGVGGCEQTNAGRSSTDSPPIEATATLPRVNASAGDSVVTIFKSPTCGCCTKWASYLERNGFNVVIRDTENLEVIKDKLGVPRDLRSCHTATYGDRVIEGHVPVEDIRGWIESESGGLLAVPGMPLGSPGMEHPRGSVTYESVFVSEDGTRRVFEHHPGGAVSR